ncbi:MAG: AEC family transporter [Pseudomonadota bacterium]
MLGILLQTLPFFAVIGLGYSAGRSGVFTEDATAYLTKFVFYFALSAMLFRFTATLSIREIFDPTFVVAYLAGTAFVYVLATVIGLTRRRPMVEAAFEAQCAVIGNVGFLGVPMLALLLGEAAVAPIILVLVVDLTIFGSLIVILINASREGRITARTLAVVIGGLARNPMIVSISAGLVWSALRFPIPGPMDDFLELLGGAATPGALFAIGASLAFKSAERLSVAGWLSFAKLVLHPAAVAVSALLLFGVAPFPAAVMIAAAALPVAGNVFILAQHYGVAPQRVSATILISTLLSVITVTAVVAWVRGF